MLTVAMITAVANNAGTGITKPADRARQAKREHSAADADGFTLVRRCINIRVTGSRSGCHS